MGKRRSASAAKVEVEYIPEADGKVAPFLGYFPSGYDATKKKNRKRPHEVDVYRHNKYPNRMQLVVSPEGSNVDYVGKSYAGEAAAAPQLCTYLLGVLDKETQTLKVVPIAANKIFRLEPRVKGVKYMDNELLEEVGNDPVTNENRRIKMLELTNKYGSKKNRILTKKMEALKQQQNDPLSQQYVEDQLKDVNVNEPEDVPPQAAVNLPPHDPAAVRPEKAYLLDKIILKMEWPHLTDIEELLESDSSDRPFQENGYPTFILNRISKARDLKDKEKRKRLTGILSYITHLVNFFHISSARDFKSKFRAGSSLGNIPHSISQRLLGLFVNPESRKVSSDKKALLIHSILVLTLFADEFRTSPKDIAVDLKMPYPILRPYFQQLGCIAEKDGMDYFMTLPVPLKFPGPVLEQRRKKPRLSRRR